MASISEALRYMADREVQITQRQRQGMQYALTLAQFEAEKSFKERQFQRDVFQTTLSRQYELNEEALGQSVGSFSSKVAAMADTVTGYSYAEEKTDANLKAYQKKLIKKGHFTAADANSIMAVLSGMDSESEYVQKGANASAQQLAVRIQNSYKAAAALGAEQADPTVKPWIDTGIVGGATREQRAANDMMMRNIAGSLKNRDSINKEFMDMTEDDFEMDTDLYELASTAEEAVAQTTVSTVDQLPGSAADRVSLIRESRATTEKDKVSLQERLNELEIQRSLGVTGLDDQISQISMDITTATGDLEKLEALEGPAQTELESMQLINIAKQGNKGFILEALENGEITQDIADNLLEIAEQSGPKVQQEFFKRKGLSGRQY
jgi:hypothetical protein